MFYSTLFGKSQHLRLVRMALPNEWFWRSFPHYFEVSDITGYTVMFAEKHKKNKLGISVDCTILFTRARRGVALRPAASLGGEQWRGRCRSARGWATLANINAPESYTIKGDGKGGADVRPARGWRWHRCSPTPPAPTSAARSLSFGSRLLDQIAKKTADQFFATFRKPVAPDAEGTGHETRT